MKYIKQPKRYLAPAILNGECLSKLISEAETTLNDRKRIYEEAEIELQNFETRQKELKEKYDVLIMWTDLYKTATGHPKKSDDFSGNPGTKRK